MLKKLKKSYLIKGIKKPSHNLFAPLLSLFILSIGIGFITTLVPVLLNDQNASPWIMGLMSTANYLGLIVGSFHTERFILRVGHIRAFSALASCITITTLSHGFITHVEYWLILRFLSGICLAGLYVAIESWLISGSAVSARGGVLALYMITLYGANGLGQFLIKFDNNPPLFLFALATLFISFSIFPLSITKTNTPKIDPPTAFGLKKLLAHSLSGSIGSFSSGLIMGSLYGLYPVFIARNFSDSPLQYYTSALIFGGMLLQYPVGRLSDIIERRTVLYSICFLSAFICMCFMFIPITPFIGVLLSFILGGFTFTIYPICISHGCDTAKSEDIVSTAQGLLLLYSVGAACGPIAASCVVNFFDKQGLMIYIVLVSLSCGIFLYFRRLNTPPSMQDEHFLPSAQTSAVLAELDPRGENVK
jgi:MFS family permease